MSAIRWTAYDSPIGPLTLVAGAAGLRRLSFEGPSKVPSEATREPMPEVTEQLVVGADGSLTGYAGGLHRKRALLDLESTRQLAIL